jgi:hypothetical protein
MQDMERRFAMKTKVLMTLLLSVLAAPVLASDTVESMFVGPAIQVAQLAPEMRRMLRERWEQASPEERMEMRRQFQERLQQRPPEEREAVRQRLREQRDQWTGRMPPPPGPADFAGAASNFGTGFEQRRPDQPGPEDNAPAFDPRNRFNPPAVRNRR